MELVPELIKQGGGYLLAAVMLYLYIVERKDHKAERTAHSATSDKLIELSTESIKSETEHTAAISALTKVLDTVERKITQWRN